MNLSKARKGKKFSEEHKENISKALKKIFSDPKNTSMWGKKHSEETKKKMSENHADVSGKNSPFYGKCGKDSPQWKGNKVGYKGLHKWIRSHLEKPEKCEFCENVEPFDLANVTGIYNRDFKNWKYLCRRCHKKYDYQKRGNYN